MSIANANANANANAHFYDLVYKPDGPSGFLVNDSALKGGYAVPSGLFLPSSNDGQEGTMKGGDIDDFDDYEDPFYENQDYLPNDLLDFFVDFAILDNLKRDKKHESRKRKQVTKHKTRKVKSDK
jgi:hypothetical protein